MDASACPEKERIRRRIRESLRFLTRAERETAGEAIARRLEGGGIFGCPTGTTPIVVCFANLWDEPSTSGIIAAALHAGARVALPAMVVASDVPQLRLVCHADLQAGMESWPRDSMGVPTPSGDPISARSATTALIPGRAFDPRGTRLGRGGGHFDRFLAQLAPGCRHVGIAFDAQVVDAIPREEHDRPVGSVVTPTRWIAADSTV